MGLNVEQDTSRLSDLELGVVRVRAFASTLADSKSTKFFTTLDNERSVI